MNINELAEEPWILKHRIEVEGDDIYICSFSASDKILLFVPEKIIALEFNEQMNILWEKDTSCYDIRPVRNWRSEPTQIFATNWSSVPIITIRSCEDVRILGTYEFPPNSWTFDSDLLMFYQKSRELNSIFFIGRTQNCFRVFNLVERVMVREVNLLNFEELDPYFMFQSRCLPHLIMIMCRKRDDRLYLIDKEDFTTYANISQMKT